MKNISPTEALNSLHPLSCFLVISADSAGKPNGMVASWGCQTSFEPPMFAVAIGKAKNTHRLIEESREFVIAVPNKDMEDAVKVFGTRKGKDTDKFAVTGVKTQKSQCLGVPLLTDATLNYECKVVSAVETGDHTIFVGEVVAAWKNDGQKVLMNMGRPGGKRLFLEF